MYDSRVRKLSICISSELYIRNTVEEYTYILNGENRYGTHTHYEIYAIWLFTVSYIRQFYVHAVFSFFSFSIMFLFIHFTYIWTYLQCLGKRTIDLSHTHANKTYTVVQMACEFMLVHAVMFDFPASLYRLGITIERLLGIRIESFCDKKSKSNNEAEH